MLTDEQVQRVRELLAANLSQREISRRTGISRDTIHRIFKGRRQEAACSRPISQPRDRRAAATANTGHRVGRCPECGARVLLPCIACRVARKTARYHSVV